MGVARRVGIAIMTASLAAGPGLGWADPPKQSADSPVDEHLLEFLGGVDSSADATQPDDGSWLAYLAQINLGKVAKGSQAPASPARPKPAAAAGAAAKPGNSGVPNG